VPIYEFKCTGCDEHEEHTLAFSDPHPESCSACGAPLKRVWSGRVHISLVGWGFSKTDGLLPDNGPRRDFKALKERAQRIVDE